MPDFGAEVRQALERRAEHLVAEGLARRQGQRVTFARDLLATLRNRELDAIAQDLSAQTGLPHHKPTEGEHVVGTFRQRLDLASGRFAMIDDRSRLLARPLDPTTRTPSRPKPSPAR